MNSCEDNCSPSSTVRCSDPVDSREPSDVTHTPRTRQAQKLRTRQALLDAALRLMEEQSLDSLGLREVTREVGIAPTAFYRHFRDIPELGTALVDESLGSLRAVIRAERGSEADSEVLIRRSVDVFVTHVHEHRAHFRFIAREMFGGVAPVRRAIRDQLRQFTDELAEDLALLPGTHDWHVADRRMLAALFVDHLVLTAAAILDVPPDRPEDEREVVGLARRQLELIVVGRRHWHDEAPEPSGDTGPADRRG